MSSTTMDVTSLFSDAAHEMAPDSVLLMDGFTLQEAMSAFEIGEPRLDTGMFNQEQSTFYPLAPLLPNELCWILDRAFGLEMEWHAGNPLCHTVHTLLYLHHINDLDPDMAPGLELVTLVLKSAVCALLKCCDFSWRQLNAGRLHDTEDWHSDKCEVSLLEGMPSAPVLRQLEDAIKWLEYTNRVAPPWQEALIARLNLRKTFLELLSTRLVKDTLRFKELVNSMRQHLHNVRAHPSTEPPPGNIALNAFDPCIARHLNVNLPIRVIPVPPVEETWKVLDRLLDGWQELCDLSQVPALSTWDIAGNMHVWRTNHAHPLALPVVRAAATSILFDGLLLINRHGPAWIPEAFFLETMGVSYTSISSLVRRCWCGPGTASQILAEFERGVKQLFPQHVQSQWYNPARRRRHLMKSTFQWQLLYDTLVRLISDLDVSGLEITEAEMLMHIPTAALLWRLSVVREIVLSGFQLELYAPTERAFAYFYLVEVLEKHLGCIDDLLQLTDPRSTVTEELSFQRVFLGALQQMAVAAFSITIPSTAFSWEQVGANFSKRYKWALHSNYDEISTPVVAPPMVHQFLPAELTLPKDPWFSPRDTFELALTMFSSIIDNDLASAGWAAQWGISRLEFVVTLRDICRDLANKLPRTIAELKGGTFDLSSIRWDADKRPWFPVVE